MQALLLAEYEIWMPNGVTLSVTNKYGTIQVDDLTGYTTISSRYGKIFLSNIHGKSSYKSYFGDFTAKNISGNIQCTFDHTKSTMDGLGGEIDFTNILGDMSLRDLNQVKSLRIAAAKSDISLIVKQLEQYKYQFATEFGEINVPTNIGGQVLKTTSGLVTWQYEKPGLPLINVKTTFGDITLQGQ
jgi:hypothetical protein